MTNALFTLFSFIFLSVRDNQTRFGVFVNYRLLLNISKLVAVNLGSYVKRFKLRTRALRTVLFIIVVGCSKDPLASFT